MRAEEHRWRQQQTAAVEVVVTIGRRVGQGAGHLEHGATGQLARHVVSPASSRFDAFARSVGGVRMSTATVAGDLLVGAPFARVEAGRAYGFSGASGALLQTLHSPNAVPAGNFGTPCPV
ncbi:MAG: hypothetical protein H0V10_17195 [Geodermatophilaceae bacterium]|nr:hypothetical protein [Geodermatophilaceae bacterium]